MDPTVSSETLNHGMMKDVHFVDDGSRHCTDISWKFLKKELKNAVKLFIMYD